MHYVYIIHSAKLNRFYVGETADLDRRIAWHNNGEFKDSSTALAKDWALFWQLECASIEVARKIELHIKRMKSRTYYHNLVRYQDITARLIELYG